MGRWENKITKGFIMETETEGKTRGPDGLTGTQNVRGL